MTVTVTIEGPSKSGKTQLANLIHNALIRAPNQRYDVSIGDECACEMSNRTDRCVNPSSHTMDVNVIVGQTSDTDEQDDSTPEETEPDVVDDAVDETETEQATPPDDGDDAQPTDDVADTEAVGPVE